MIKDADENGVGTLWVRGPNIFRGYLNNDAVNKELFDKDGWFNTGDLVYLAHVADCSLDFWNS